MYYIVTIGFETEDNRGNPKTQKVKYIVEGQSVEEVTIVIAKYINDDARSGELLSVMQMPIECVIDHNNEPKYY